MKNKENIQLEIVQLLTFNSQIYWSIKDLENVLTELDDVDKLYPVLEDLVDKEIIILCGMANVRLNEKYFDKFKMFCLTLIRGNES